MAMLEPTEFEWIGDPTDAGWYAVTVCWDAQEGAFPSAARWDGERWDDARPIGGHAGPFADKATAEAWAYAHDPEA